MKQYKVEITTLCDYTATADDAVVTGQGLKAYNDLLAEHSVVIADADGAIIEIIPFHAVCHAKVTVTTTEDEPVVDANCNETNEDAPAEEP